MFSVALGYRTSPRPERAVEFSDSEEKAAVSDGQAAPALPLIAAGPAGELDRWVVMAGMIPCYREDPRVVSWIQGLPADQEVVDWTYVRETHGSNVTLRQLDLVVAEGHPVVLAQCLSEALDGMSWPQPLLQEPPRELSRESNDEPFRLVLQASALGQLLREVGY